MLNYNRRSLFISLAIVLLLLPLCFFSGPLWRYVLSHETEQYAVVFDAGSTGSRVHVFRFNEKMELLPIGNRDMEFYMTTEPGLSSYADNPKAGANSLRPLLKGAEGAVPKKLQSETPLELGATAGLRMLKGHAAEKLLQAVRELVKNEGTFYSKDQWVTILDGNQEGSYMWAAINYLLGNLGKSYERTTATIDLGGGSVEVAYGISKEQFAKAPKNEDGEPYVLAKHLMSKDYYLYVHSYLNYGQLAARAEILKLTNNQSNNCILEGYDGYYSYGGLNYRVLAPPHGSTSWWNCMALTTQALKVDAPCKNKNCTFNGVWNGGGGDGLKSVHVSSFFYDIGAQVGVVNPLLPSTKTQPIEYLRKASIVCQTKAANVKSKFPNAEDRDIPYLCMDLVYQYSLLAGLGFDSYEDITVVHDIRYKNHLVGAAWPLGCAIDLVTGQNIIKLMFCLSVTIILSSCIFLLSLISL